MNNLQQKKINDIKLILLTQRVILKTRWFFILIFISAGCTSHENNVSITVNANQEIDEVEHTWAWFGYDESNYTYMKYGKITVGGTY